MKEIKWSLCWFVWVFIQISFYPNCKVLTDMEATANHLHCSRYFYYFRYGDTLLASKCETFKVYSISTRLPVNNHRSFFFYLNIFFFRNMTSFRNFRRFLSTTASKPCFALYVIYLVVLYVFGIDVLSRMNFGLLCIYLIHFLCHIRLTNV